MRKLFMLVASVALMAPAFALDPPPPPTLGDPQTFTLTVTDATIGKYAKVLANNTDVGFSAAALDPKALGWFNSTPAVVQVESNVDLLADLHFGGPLVLQNTGGRNDRHPLETALYLTYTGELRSPTGDWETTHTPDNPALPVPAGYENQAFEIRHGNLGATMNLVVQINRYALNDPAGNYKQDDATKLTLSYID